MFAEAHSEEPLPDDEGLQLGDTSRVRVFRSAVATYYAPSDLSGVGGMHREHIRATPTWRRGPPRYDCVYISKDPSQDGFRGLFVGRVRLFFSFRLNNREVECALIEEFSEVSDEPDEETGMWIVAPDLDYDGSRTMSVVLLDSILRAAHLIGVAGEHLLPRNFPFSESLDAFNTFYVNKYADHHAHEIAF